MSTIGVTFHNEDIHNIIYKPVARPTKASGYKSKRGTVYQPTEGARHSRRRTSDQASNLSKTSTKTQPPSPKGADKGEAKEIAAEGEAKEAAADGEAKEATADGEAKQPRTSSKASLESGQRPSKNYVQENIRRVSDIQPKPIHPRSVDAPGGSVKDMDHVLQMKKLRESDKYGKIPKYLCERKKQWERERKQREEEELAIKRQKEKMGIGTMGMSEDVYMVDKETRQKILDGLKENWNELSKQFLKLPVIIDTYPKMKKKIWLENEIEQLEKDIRLVETHPYIYLHRHDRRSLAQMAAEEMSRKGSEEQKKEEVTETEKQDGEEKEVAEGDQPKEKAEDQEVAVLTYCY